MPEPKSSTIPNSVNVNHFSDILCIWAYISQIRMDELEVEFANKVEINYHLFPVFGDVPGKMASNWGHRGGIQAYNRHVLEVAEKFEHLPLNKEAWLKNTPQSCLPAHLHLCATRQAEQHELVASGSFTLLKKAIRKAFFCDLMNIGDRAVLTSIIETTGLPSKMIGDIIDGGEAYAALAADMQKAKELDIRSSPTLIFNEDRQRLAGNVGYKIIKANISELLEHPTTDQSWC
jgi:predicted DsbA family dithiol-disulfide isomerase